MGTPHTPTKRNHHTVRFAALRAETFTCPLNAGCVVLFARSTKEGTRATAYLHQIAGLGLPATAKVVLHVRRPGPIAESLDTRAGDVTVFVHPWELLTEPLSSTADAVPRVLGTLLDILHGVQLSALRVTVVGLERLPPRCLGLEKFDAGLTEAVAEALDAMAYPPQPAYQGFRPAFSSGPPADPLAAVLDDRLRDRHRCAVNFCSMEKYRARVGPEQFAIETDEDALWYGRT